MEPIENYYYESWIDFLKYQPSKDSIFRGQSSSEWKLISSYHRNKRPYNFLTFGFYESDSVKKFSHLYSVEPFKSILGGEHNLSIIEFLQVLQHYGFNTPLIDFTRDKLTALYFAAIGLSEHEINYDVSRNKKYFSVFELRLNLLQRNFNVIDASQSLLANNWELLEKQSFYRELINSKEPSQPFIYTVLHPNYAINENAKKQSGVFLLFDSAYDNEKEKFKYFDEWLENQIIAENFKINEPILKIHSICYESILDNHSNCTNLFAYLMSKDRIGYNLFSNDDLQGLKYDYNNELAIRTLKCVDNKSNCECIKNLSILGIY